MREEEDFDVTVFLTLPLGLVISRPKTRQGMGCVCDFFHTSTFQLLGKSRGHRSRPFFPPGSCFKFLSRIGFSNPTARRFLIECCQLTLSRFPQVNLQFVHKKSSYEFI